jgi:hypothetical protein
MLKDTSLTHEIYANPILPTWCNHLTHIFGIYDVDS